MKALLTSTIVLALTLVSSAALDLENSVAPVMLGDKVICTTFSLAPTMWLTAAHCAREGITVKGSPTRVVKVDQDRDLALLNAPDMMAAGIKLAKDNPKKGDVIRTEGHGMGERESIAYVGIVSHPSLLVEGYKKYPLVWIYPNVVNGMSGSPLVNQQDEVVGMVVGGGRPNEPGDLIGLAIRLEEIKKFLKD